MSQYQYQYQYQYPFSPHLPCVPLGVVQPSVTGTISPPSSAQLNHLGMSTMPLTTGSNHEVPPQPFFPVSGQFVGYPFGGMPHTSIPPQALVASYSYLTLPHAGPGQAQSENEPSANKKRKAVYLAERDSEAGSMFKYPKVDESVVNIQLDKGLDNSFFLLPIEKQINHIQQLDLDKQGAVIFQLARTRCGLDVLAVILPDYMEKLSLAGQKLEDTLNLNQLVDVFLQTWAHVPMTEGGRQSTKKDISPKETAVVLFEKVFRCISRLDLTKCKLDKSVCIMLVRFGLKKTQSLSVLHVSIDSESNRNLEELMKFIGQTSLLRELKVVGTQQYSDDDLILSDLKKAIERNTSLLRLDVSELERKYKTNAKRNFFTNTAQLLDTEIQRNIHLHQLPEGSNTPMGFFPYMAGWNEQTLNHLVYSISLTKSEKEAIKKFAEDGTIPNDYSHFQSLVGVLHNPKKYGIKLPIEAKTTELLDKLLQNITQIHVDTTILEEVGLEAFWYILKNCPYITEVNFSQSYYHEDAVNFLTKALLFLQKNDHLSKLSYKSPRSHEVPESLFSALCKIVQKNQLQCLDICTVSFNTDQLQVLLDILAHNSSIKHLGLSMHSIGNIVSDGKVKLVEVIKIMLERNKLETLAVSRILASELTLLIDLISNINGSSSLKHLRLTLVEGNKNLGELFIGMIKENAYLTQIRLTTLEINGGHDAFNNQEKLNFLGVSEPDIIKALENNYHLLDFQVIRQNIRGNMIVSECSFEGLEFVRSRTWTTHRNLRMSHYDDIVKDCILPTRHKKFSDALTALLLLCYAIELPTELGILIIEALALHLKEKERTKIYSPRELDTLALKEEAKTNLYSEPDILDNLFKSLNKTSSPPLSVTSEPNEFWMFDDDFNSWML